MPVGTEKVKQAGANGVKTETYLVKSLNGKVVSREVISRDTYNAMQRIILKGTKGATKNNTTTTTQEATSSEQNQQTTQTPESNKGESTENNSQIQTETENKTNTNTTNTTNKE